MVKIRLIPTLLYREPGLVKGERFDSWRRIGGVVQSIRVYNLREVDELVFLDITATRESRPPDYAAIDEFADDCFMPFTVGGGIKTTDDVRMLLRAGADKVAINSEAVNKPEIIKEAARKRNDNFEVHIHSGETATGLDPAAHAKRVEALGAGELIVTSIDQDGMMTGYDLDLIKSVSDAVSIPVIASGGAGCPQDFVDAINIGKASSVAAAAIFHFTEITPSEVKAYMKESGLNVRI